MPPKSFAVKKPRTAKSFRLEAFNRLAEKYADGSEEAEEPGLAADCEGEPTVTPILKGVDGGIPAIMEALRSHDDADAKSFIKLYDSLTAKDRQYLTLEEIAVASGIGSLRLAEVATSATILHGQMKAKLLIASSMHKVTKSIVKAATDEVPITAWDTNAGVNMVVGHTNGDTKAMELFGKMSGMVPVPKGSQIIVNPIAKSSDDGDDDTDRPYLDSGERLRLIHDAVEPRRLPSPASDPIGGRVSHMQDDVAEVLSHDV